MDGQPSYRKPTRASLNRATTFVKCPRPKKPIDKMKLGQRKRLATLRIDTAEKLRLFVVSSEKWPTKNSVRIYRQCLANPMAEGASLSKQPAQKSAPTQAPLPTSSSTPNNLSNLSSEFPFQISSFRDMTTFPQFPHLPVELRLQIWREGITVPKFIEVQYCSDDSRRDINSPYRNHRIARVAQILNHHRYDPLFSVCLESREVAQAHSPKDTHIQLSHFEILQDEWRNHNSAVLNPEPVFVPTRDTIFFRPMDHSLDNSLRTLFINFRGHTSTLQHIAIPLDLEHTIPCSRYWTSEIRAFPKLKTLTFMLGCAEKSWTGDPSIEMRDLEQWFMDGRKRTVEIDAQRRVTMAMSDRGEDREMVGHVDVTKLADFVAGCTMADRDLAVRVVAWKRKRSR